MSAEEETAAQRQARIRQQKREAKIKASGQDRLDKITKLSGRTPETMSTSSPIRPATPQTNSTQAVAGQPPSVAAGDWMTAQSDTPEQRRLQEDYMRILLGGAQPGQTGQPQSTGQPGEEDPMIKMMQTMLGGMSGDPNAPGAGELPFSADDMSKMTGIPSFLTGMFMGGKQQAPPSPEQISKERTWKILRVVLSILIGIYAIFTVDSSVKTFGQNPPAPATARNPFLVFLTGQLLINGAKVTLAGNTQSQGGIKSYYRTVKDVAADGAILIFMLGVYSWWSGFA